MNLNRKFINTRHYIRDSVFTNKYEHVLKNSKKALTFFVKAYTLYKNFN
jgi:hypothetical protein